MSRVRVITRDNGVGLSRDLALVTAAFHDAGHDVDVMAYHGNRLRDRYAEIVRRLPGRCRPAVDLQVFLERIYPRMLSSAARNVLVPNPEWFPVQWQALLPRFDGVACKTAHGAAVFRQLGCRVVDAGFTSDDVFDPAVRRRRQFFHLAGRSEAKGTAAIVAAWARHPEWPQLVLVQNPKRAREKVVLPNLEHRLEYLDATALRRLQNESLFHLCPSEIEGFGHYINEALSTGAIVLTTDAAPMNELVADTHGLLVPPVSSRKHGMVDGWRVDAAGIERAVATALSLDAAELETRSALARQRFLSRDARFRSEFARQCLRAAGLE